LIEKHWLSLLPAARKQQELGSWRPWLAALALPQNEQKQTKSVSSIARIESSPTTVISAHPSISIDSILIRTAPEPFGQLTIQSQGHHAVGGLGAAAE
jgi:hypothetical protein